LASSSLTEPAMITSSPCFQFTGVATLCLAVSCIESSTRRISSKLRPGGHRVGQHQLDLLVRADDEDRAHRGVGGGGAAVGGAGLFGRQHVVELGHGQVGVADHRVLDRVALGFLDVGGPRLWLSTGSTDRPISLVLRLVNSGSILAM
jgi:hypothetical protein